MKEADRMANDLILYELINPSDPYTFFASSREVAVLTVLALAPNGLCGATPLNGDITLDVPVFWLISKEEVNEWFNAHFGRSIDDALAVLGNEIADALDSFILGTEAERKLYEKTISLLDSKEKIEAFNAEWDDAKRTSLANYSPRAKMLAEAFRGSTNSEKSYSDF